MPTSQNEIDDGYKLWGERFVREGWSPYLLTFMYEHLGGSDARVAREMEREIERVYATLVTRVVRKPTAPSSAGRLPVWLCCRDMPVFKNEKQCLSDVLANDGLHTHAAAFQPPVSRLGVDLATHFEEYRDLYVRRGLPLIRIDVQPITHDIGYVMDYVRKQIGRGMTGEDTMLILPRGRTEMKDALTGAVAGGHSPKLFT